MKVYKKFADGCFRLFVQLRLWRLRKKSYKGIYDMPAFNWWKMHETKNPAFLFRNRSGVIPFGLKELSPSDARAMQLIWKKIYSQYIEVFGFGEKLIESLNLQKKIARLRLQKIETLDRSFNTRINIELEKLKALQAELGGTVDYYDMKNMIQRSTGVPVTMQTSVYEFYSEIKSIQKNLKPMKHVRK